MSALAIGLCAGLVVGVPAGPVGGLALCYASKRDFSRVWALAAGTVLAEAMVAIIVAAGVAQAWPSRVTNHPAMRFAFALFLIVAGANMFLRPLSAANQSSGGVGLGLGQGAGITLINPGVAAGYVSILLGCKAATWPAISLIPLALGVIAASGAWWAVFVPVLRLLLRIGKTQWMTVLVKALGVVFVIAGIVVVVRTALA